MAAPPFRVGIPPHRPDGTLPPYSSDDSQHQVETAAPYGVALLDIVERLVISEARARLFLRYLAFCEALREQGLVQGLQWIGGSFVELRKTEPNDIDLLTFYRRPRAWTDRETELAAVGRSPHLFDRSQAKAQFDCDARFVELTCPPEFLLNWATRWYVLYAHDRAGQWNGFLQVKLPPPAEIEEARGAVARLFEGLVVPKEAGVCAPPADSLCAPVFKR